MLAISNEMRISKMLGYVVELEQLAAETEGAELIAEWLTDIRAVLVAALQRPVPRIDAPKVAP
jgi:hypothetical protein